MSRRSRRCSADAALSADDRLHLGFALGKAREDSGEDDAAFAAYAEANRLRRAAAAARCSDAVQPDRAIGRDVHARPDRALRRRGRSRARSDLRRRPAALGIDAGRADPRQPSRDRSDDGAARSAPAWPARSAPDGATYPEALAEPHAATTCATLGARYLAATRIQRKTDRPFFVDKLPANFLFVGLIRLILPNARIIDVRRHPLGCGVSLFRQHFATGHAFAYDLAEIGRYYADYVRLMALWDERFPGAVHRLIYEDLVGGRGRRGAAVARLSGPAVRPRVPALPRDRARGAHPQRRASPPPAQRRRAGPWRRYAPWLGPLEAALGDTLDACRALAIRQNFPLLQCMPRNSPSGRTGARSDPHHDVGFRRRRACRVRDGMAAAHSELTCGANRHLTLNDASAMKVQSQDIVAAFRRLLADPPINRGDWRSWSARPCCARQLTRRSMAAPRDASRSRRRRKHGCSRPMHDAAAA